MRCQHTEEVHAITDHLDLLLLLQVPSLTCDVVCPHLQNTNITRLKIGPQNLILSQNEKLVSGPTSFVKIPPGHFCVVLHPLDKK